MPADDELLRPADRFRLRGWIPWRSGEGGVVVATSVPPSDAMVAEAALLLGTPVVGVRTAPDGEIRAVLDRSAPPADLL